MSVDINVSGSNVHFRAKRRQKLHYLMSIGALTNVK